MKRLAFAVAIGCSATVLFAQQPGRIMTVTRGVTVFTNLEHQLDDALQARNEAALTRLLAANFEQRNATAPSAPVPRADWLQHTSRPAEISQMAVHEYGDVAVVSFLDAAQSAFVVDVWKKTGDDYQLSVRYASAAAAAPQTQPENPAK